MSGEDERFLQRLLATFRVEADEHLKAMSSLLLQLETIDHAAAHAEDALALLETLYREAHSLKGAARAVGHAEIEMICQALESVLSTCRQAQRAPPADAFDILHRTLDAIGQRLVPGEDDVARPAMDASAIVQALATLPGTGPAPVLAPMPAPIPVPAPTPRRTAPLARGGDETVRISSVKLGRLLIEAEEMLVFKFGAEHRADDVRALQTDIAAWRKTWEKHARNARALRRAASRSSQPMNEGKKARALMALLDAIEHEQSFIKLLAERVDRMERVAAHERRAFTSMVDNLLADTRQALMLPFSSLLEPFPKLVRDLARDCGKQVALVIEGDSLEVDRRVLEQIKDPLIHLLRNAVDHGIETPDERTRQGKPARGRISIDIAAPDANRIELEFADDGRGIDVARVIATAVQEGVITAEAAQGLSEREALTLIFESGLSTSPVLTGVSGRGLGLAIVREKVELLGGCIRAEQAAGGGTRFCIMLPASLTTFRGLLIRTGDRRFVLPSRNVDCVARVSPDAVRTMRQRDTVEINDEPLPLLRLGDVLGVEHDAGSGSAHMTVMVLASDDRRIAFVVDQVLGDEEVLVKSLGPLLARVRNIAGATVLGAGQVVPILNVADLLKSALKAAPNSPVNSPGKTAPAAPPPRHSVLLAEDSITSRSLLQNILESAGYAVTAVVDGAEAFTALRERHFDLLVSDVEMPRMDGFALTARVRADQRLAELPVVLVTSLESREQRERGVEAGADAYIVKSSFDRSNLLEAVRRLI